MVVPAAWAAVLPSTPPQNLNTITMAWTLGLPIPRKVVIRPERIRSVRNCDVVVRAFVPRHCGGRGVAHLELRVRGGVGDAAVVHLLSDAVRVELKDSESNY